jgi:asparagine synthase (glutamine-hydrolysing)
MSVFLGLFYIPAPWTIYKNVRKLHPGHYLILSKDGLEEREYFDLDYTKKHTLTAQEAEQELAGLFRRSVQRQMLSDVPVGVLLSGGLDSRSALAAANEISPGLSSFTIVFDEGAFNEGDAAAAWAKVFGSPHHTYLFREDDFVQGMLSWLRHVDEPFAPWANVAKSGLARFIQAQDYKVVLGGDGGDELFLGYPTVHAANVARYYRRLLPRAVRDRLIRPAVRRLRAGSGLLPLSFKLKSFVEADHPDIFRNFFGFKEVIRYSEWPDLLTSEALRMVGQYDPFIAHEQYLPRVQGLHFVDALSYLDFRTFLGGCCFKAGDNAYMSSSVEMRVPFMDNDLVEFACRLPVPLRFHPYRLKTLLRKALLHHFRPPHGDSGNLLKQYRKVGFEVPASLWLRQGRLGQFLRTALSRKRVEATGFFRPEAVERLLDEQFSRKSNNERVLQAILSLVLFLEGDYAL